MTMANDNESHDYPVFRGLQRPLEFLGLQGRYIYWAGATVGGGLLGFIILYILFGFITALVYLTVVLGVGGVVIFVKQRRGLHSKKDTHGIFIYRRSREF